MLEAQNKTLRNLIFILEFNSTLNSLALSPLSSLLSLLSFLLMAGNAVSRRNCGENNSIVERIGREREVAKWA